MYGPSTIVQRLLTAAAMIVAFVFMASIFSPDTTRAGQPLPGASRGRISDWTPRPNAGESSTDPHEGLRSLGELETLTHFVRIYATPIGARYTIVNRANGEIEGTLLSVDDVERFFPELSIRDIQFDAAERTESTPGTGPGPLMLVEPVSMDQW